MSLTPVALMDQTIGVKMSKNIFYSSYILMSKRRDTNGLTDLTEQYHHLDHYFWASFLALIPILLVIGYGYQWLFGGKTLSQTDLWSISRIVLNQGSDRIIAHFSYQLISVYFPQNRLNCVSSLVSLYILCYTFIRISIDSFINVSLVISEQKNIDSLEDLVKDKRVLPALYKATNLERLMVF